MYATKAGGPCGNTIHLFRSVYFSAKGKKNLKEVFEMITCFYFLLPTTTRNEMISQLDRWENHCLMPAGWFLCSSSHFEHNMQQLSWIQRTTFNFIQNPTVVLCFHHAGESGTLAPSLARTEAYQHGNMAFTENKGAALHVLLRLLNCLYKGKLQFLPNCCCSKFHLSMSCLSKLLLLLFYRWNRGVLSWQMAMHPFWSV